MTEFRSLVKRLQGAGLDELDTFEHGGNDDPLGTDVREFTRSLILDSERQLWQSSVPNEAKTRHAWKISQTLNNLGRALRLKGSLWILQHGVQNRGGRRRPASTMPSSSAERMAEQSDSLR